MKQKLFKKALSVVLSALMLTTTGLALPAVVESGTVTVSAAQTYGDFEYEVNADNTVTITKYTGSGGNVTIQSSINGNSVTCIGESAFKNCKSLTIVTIPSSVTIIGNEAFYGCTGLTSVTIPNSVTSIGFAAFGSCTGLTGITIPDSVTSIDEFAFYQCTALTGIAIPAGVTSIEWCSFAGCTGLTSVTIPSSVTDIVEGAFSGCTSLTSITIPGSVASIGEMTFYGCTSLTSITIPDSVTSIERDAFSGCTGLASITIPDSVTSFGDNAFKDCTHLTIYGIPGSYAEIYASEKEIPFKTMKVVEVTGISLNHKSVTITNGSTVQLTATIAPSDTTSKAIIWTTSNSSVATVSNGTVTAVATGTATITAETRNGKTAACTVKIYLPLVNTSTLSDTNLILGSGLTITCSATGGASPYQYALFFKKDGDTKFSKYKDFSEENNLTFKPLSATTYTLRSKVKDNTGRVVYNDYTFKVTKPFSNTSAISTKELVLGSNLTVTGSASDGVGPYMYALFTKEIGSADFTQYRGFSADNVITFTPQNATTYILRVMVMDQEVRVTYKDFTVKVTKPLTNTTTLSTTSLTLGNSLTMTGSATGGTEPYQFALFFKKDGETKFSKFKDFSEKNIITFKPQSATTYTLRTKAKDSTGKVVYKDFTVNVLPPLKNTSTLSTTELILGSSLTMTGSATGGTEPYQFALSFKKDGDTKFSKFKDFGEENIITFKPQSSITYTLRTKAKDSTGKVIYKDFTVNVLPPLKNATTLSTTNLTLGESLTMTGSATGGTSPYQYALFFKKSGSSDFTKYKDFSTTNKITFKPQSATTYILRTKVKDKTGKVIYKDFTVTVTK